MRLSRMINLMTLCHMSHHLDNKMSVKNNKTRKVTTSPMTNFAYDEYQTLDPPDQFDDTFYTINDYWNDDNDNDPELLYNEDTLRQVDDKLVKQEPGYVPHIQDGYNVEQLVQEGYHSCIEAIPNSRAQEVDTAYPNLDLTHAKEVHHNWVPMPVKVVGPKPEPCELFCYEQAHSELPNMHFVVKVEPSSLTSTPRKKAHFVRGEEICPMLTPKVQSRTTAKLTNIFADDLPNSDKKPLTIPQRKSSTVKTYNIQLTESGAAGDYDLFTPNR